ncbi:SERTA domain-containing protein 2-like [Osmerus mordax]|uniref:SERTA domain-containing protein 2-like n=1 Tax=Osmerus mordax TaxID=8014 RepID=UPI00350F0A87
MLGNGVKRKLEEDELEDGRDVLAAGGGVPSRASYTLQRQTVLNISLMKLYGPRTAAEPGLKRRVLINNMIRRIHDEFKEEGGLRALFFSVAPATQSAAMEEDEGYHEAPHSPFGVLSSSLPGLSPLDSCLTPASLLEDDPPLFFALPPSSPHPGLHPHSSPRPPPLPSPKDSFASALEEIEELCPTSLTTSATSPSLPSPSAPSQTTRVPSAGTNMKDEGKALSPRDPNPLMQEEGSAVKAAEPLPPSNTDTSSSSGAFLTDFALDDILFTDIDTSMYDFNPGGSAPNSKMAPVVTTDDLVKTISTFGGGGGSSPSPLSQNQTFKMDLAELDHIMEVLVGS